MINITNREAKARHHAEMLRQMAVLEHKWAKKVSPVLNRQYMDVARLVAMGITRGYEHLIDKQDTRLKESLAAHYRQVATTFSEQAFEAIEKEIGKAIYLKTPKDEFWRVLNTWMATQAAKKIRYIKKTTKDLIALLIQKGMNEGESHREIAKRVRKAGYISNPKRALTIARTETHSAAVHSVRESVRSSKLKTEKEWDATRDERVRADHISADGQRRPEEEPFDIGGVKMDYPGDPRGGADQVIHCRCVLFHHVIRP